jgi:hypothetical protein
LHERAGQLLLFPRRRRLAGAQPHDHVLPAHRLAGAEGHVLDDAVALVEDPEDGHALRHRRHAALSRGRHQRFTAGRRERILLLLFAAPACGEPQRNEQRCSEPVHAYSGIHGS